MELKKCLVVDDDELGRNLVAQNMPEVSCVLATNGREAVDQFTAALAAGEPFNLVVMDIMMPEMNGHEAGKAIRQVEKAQGVARADQARILMLTALNSPQDAMDAMMSFQSAAYLVKPIDAAKLKDTVSKLGLKIPK